MADPMARTAAGTPARPCTCTRIPGDPEEGTPPENVLDPTCEVHYDRPAVLALLDQADAVRQAVRAIHHRDECGYCVGCGPAPCEDPVPWPCDTYKATAPTPASWAVDGMEPFELLDRPNAPTCVVCSCADDLPCGPVCTGSLADDGTGPRCARCRAS